MDFIKNNIIIIICSYSEQHNLEYIEYIKHFFICISLCETFRVITLSIQKNGSFIKKMNIVVN